MRRKKCCVLSFNDDICLLSTLLFFYIFLWFDRQRLTDPRGLETRSRQVVMAAAMLVDISIPQEALSHFLWKMGHVRLVTSPLGSMGPRA